MWESILGWNWDTIFLGIIALFSFMNNLAINHGNHYDKLHFSQREEIYKKVDEILLEAQRLQ